MRRARPTNLWRWIRRHRLALGVVCIAAYVVAGTGAVPLPSPAVLAWVFGGAGDEAAYPCQGHGCGCVDAEACRTNCCCFTPEEQRAWYAKRARGVAVASAAALEDDGAVCGSRKSVRTTEHACCGSKKPAEPVTSCCSAKECDKPGAPAPDERDDQPENARDLPSFLLTLSPLGCKGVDSWMLVAVPVPPLARGFGLPVEAPDFGAAAWMETDAPRLRALEVPTPPPRA